MKNLLFVFFAVFFAVNQLAAQKCQCVDYVKCKTGISGTTANAMNWGTVLTNNGYKKVSEPKYGDIVVMSKNHPSLEGTTLGVKYGHIGICTYSVAVSGGYHIDLTGASQGKRESFTECGCSNVSKWTALKLTGTRLAETTFYRKQ
jgi:hypothetical protein